MKKDWLRQLHEDHDVSKNDFLFTDWMPAIIMVLIILLAFAIPALFSSTFKNNSLILELCIKKKIYWSLMRNMILN